MLCPFCFGPKRLLDGKGVRYHEIVVMMDPARRQK